MNYNNWNGRRSGRGRGRNRNKWNWRGRSFTRLPMLDPAMHNPHPGYNQNYQMHHENRSFYNYKPFVSPSHRKISPPPKPPSPLPGTEEYTQRNIQHASDLIKRQLNIDSDTCSASDTDLNTTSEHSSDKTKDDKVAESGTFASTVSSTRNEPKKNTNSQQSSKQKATSKPSECINVQEIYTQIIQHISNLSHSKKINLVNQSTDGYDIAIQQVQKQKRLELSRALRDMSKRQTQNSNDGEVINAIIPDIGIKIEDLPKEVIADLSRTLHIELEDRIEHVNNLVDPEVCFKQAEAILSVNFENDQDFNQNAPCDNFRFQRTINTFSYDYLNKPLSPQEFIYNQLEESKKFAAPSTSKVQFTIPKSFPEMNSEEVKREETESDDFSTDIDFCIKNLDVHKSYLTCFSSRKQLESRNTLFESTEGSFKLPQIKVRTDLLTQSPIETETVVESRNFLTDPLQNLQNFSTITGDVHQLPSRNVFPNREDNELLLNSPSGVPHIACSKLPDGLENTSAKIESNLILDLQLEENLKSDATRINSPTNLVQITQETVGKAEQICPESLNRMKESDKSKESKYSEKLSAKVTQHVCDYEEKEFAETNEVGKSILQPFPIIDEKAPSNLEFIDDVKRDITNLKLAFPKSSFIPTVAQASLPDEKSEIALSELIVEETKVFPNTHIKMGMSPASCSDNEGTSNHSINENKNTSLSTISESVLHTHSDGPQKRWKSPGEKKMIPNITSSISQSMVQDNLNVAEKSIDDILGEPDDITKNILEQMEEFNRSLMGTSAEKGKNVIITTNKQDADKELNIHDNKNNVNFLMMGTTTQINEETQNQSTAGSQPIETDEYYQKSAKSEPKEDQETTCTVDAATEKQREHIKMEVKEEIPEALEPIKGDELDVKNINIKFPIESIELKKELTEDKLEIASLKSKDIKSEPVERDIDGTKSKHKESNKDRSRSNSREKQHHRSGSKWKGHHEESHRSSKNKNISKPKETQDGGSSYRKIKTPAEKKETMNLKILKSISAVSTQTDFIEQPKKVKREVARNFATTSIQTDTKKRKVMGTQTDLAEQQPSKKARTSEEKDLSTQTDFSELSQNNKVKTYTLSTQTDSFELFQTKKVRTYTLSTQTDFVELVHSKKGKPNEKKEAKSVQTDFCDPKKGKSEKIKSKSSGTQSEAPRIHCKEVQATSSFKSIEIQTDPIKMSFSDDAVDINLNTDGLPGKLMLRKYAVRKLKDISAQIEHLMKLQQSFYEVMLESDDEPEAMHAQSTTEFDSPKIKQEKKDLHVQLEDVQQDKQISSKESTPKSRKRKADMSKESKNSKVLKCSDEAEGTVIESVDEVVNKKNRRKRKIEEERNAADSRGPLNIKISLKNLKTSPYRNEEETIAKQKPRKGRDTKTRDRGTKVKEERECGSSSCADTAMYNVITEEIQIKEEIPDDITMKQETPDFLVEDQSDTEEQKPILKIKLPIKRFRSKKINSEARELVEDVDLRMNDELGKISHGADTRSKRKMDRRSKQTANYRNPIDLKEVRKHEYNKRFFSCNVSLTRYNIRELNQLKETIHSKVEVKSERALSETSEVNTDNFSEHNVIDFNESLLKSESVIESSPSLIFDKTNLEISPMSMQMLDELKQIVDSVPKTSEFAVTSDTATIDHQEIEFDTFNSALLILKVINSVMLAGSDTGKLYFYDIENGNVLHAMHLSKKPLTCICISKNEDKSNVYVGSLNGKISVFDFETKHIKNTIKLDEGVQCMELSWDYIFIGTHKGQLVRYDLKKEKVDDSIKIYDTSILAIKATQEGARRVLLLATRNELVSVRDAMTGLLMRTMDSSFYPTVYTILLNNNFVYCGTSHHDILVYMFQDGQMAFTHEATNSKGVACLKIVKNLLFAGCYNGNVYVYNVATNNYLGQIVGPGMILSLEVLEDKIFLATKNNKLKSLRIPKNFLDQF